MSPPEGLPLVRPALESDIDELNELFSFSFTDRYRKDGLAGVRVPKLNPEIWRYAIRDAGDGAMLWFEGDEMIAFNLAHYSGVEGWMGPLAVRPDHQSRGLGHVIVEAAVDWLKESGATTIGLETMPRTVENIGFYGNLGFLPGHLTVSLGRLVDVQPESEYRRLGSLGPDERETLIADCCDRIGHSLPGYDFAREYRLTHDLAVGETIVLYRGDSIEGVCLCHTAALAANRVADEVRVLKLFVDSPQAFERMLDAVEHLAWEIGLPEVSVRAQSAQSTAYAALQRRGYRVRWTDLRMTLSGYAESPLPAGETMFSNWEI